MDNSPIGVIVNKNLSLLAYKLMKNNANENAICQLGWQAITAMTPVKLYAGDIPNEERYKDWIGLSITKQDDRHILHDITKPFPLGDNTVDSFQSEDVFEHISYEMLVPIINEIHRILKQNGLFRLSVPDYGCNILRDRSVRNVEGNIIFDPEGGGTPENPGHVWFPCFNTVKALLEQSLFAKCGKIDYLHYYNMDGTFVTRQIDYTKGHIQRTPDFDKRVQNPYRPMSLVIDLTKKTNTEEILNLHAKQALQEGNIQNAKEILSKILSQLPDNIKALNNLAVVEILEKNWDAAAETLRRVLHLDPSNRIVLENTKQLERHLVLYKAVLEAEKLIGQKQYIEAGEILEKVLEIDKNHIDALNNIAKIKIAKNDSTRTQQDRGSSAEFPKLSFVIIVLNGMPFLDYAIKAIYNIAHEIIIVEGSVKDCLFAANPDGSSKDGTVECVNNFPDTDHKIRLIQGFWPEKLEMQNKALEYVTGDYVWLVDSDEIYTEDALNKVKDLILKDPSITQINFIPDNFWKGFDYLFVSPVFFQHAAHYRRVFKFIKGARFSSHRPPTLFLPDENISTEQVNLIDGNQTRQMGIIPFHYSYVLEAQVKQKIELYNRYGWGKMWKIDLNDWYQNCYLKWSPENKETIEKRYPVWTGGKNSYTERFTGQHPDVIKEYISHFKGSDGSKAATVLENITLPIIGNTYYQQKVLDAWQFIELDAPLESRRKTIQENIKSEQPFWNIHVALAFIADKLQPKTYLEVGVRTGGSMVQVLSAANPDHVVAVDLWEGNYSSLPNYLDYTINQLNRFQKRVKKTFEIDYIQRDSHKKLKELISQGKTFDLITVDGDHSLEGSREDLEDAIRLLANQGVIVFDDIIHISFKYLLNLVYEIKCKYPFLTLLLNTTQDNGCAIFLKNTQCESLLKTPHHKAKGIKVAGDYDTGQNLTKVAAESEFARCIRDLFGNIKPKKIIETGTYQGEGTTRVIASTIMELGLTDTKFFSIECNPGNYAQAVYNLNKSNLLPFVKLLNGLSTPRKYLPTIQEIENQHVKNIEFDNIFIDHKDHERALLYFKETDFSDVPDDLLGICLRQFNYTPDFVLLDSGGHMGNIEFNYLISQLQGVCVIALDDIYHIKHHKSFLQIKSDTRFELIVESKEKFGFCIARFNPQSVVAHDPKNINNIIWVRTDSIGDNVLSASMLPYIRERYNNAQITIVCQAHIAELYEACPFVDNIISYNKLLAYQDEQYRINILKALKKVNSDLALNSVYSREPLTDAFTIGSNAKERIAFYGNLCNISAESRDKHNQFYTRLLQSDTKPKLELERHRDYLDGLGIKVQSLQPAIWITPEDEAFAEEFFRKNNLSSEKTITLFAGAQSEVRFYHQYGIALSQICKDNQFTVIAFGTEHEYVINQQNLEQIGGCTINLSGKTTIRQTAALLKRCKAAIGAETGTAHIACAVGIPNVILLGGGHFGRFMPYSPLTSVVCLPLECYGCSWKCKYQTVHCVKDISPGVIAEAVLQTLKNTSRKPRIFVQGNTQWNPQANQPQWQRFDKFLDINSVEIILVDNVPQLAKALTEMANVASQQSLEILNLQAKQALQEGDILKAKELLSKILSQLPDNIKALNNLAVVEILEKNWDAATETLRKVLYLDPSNKVALENTKQLERHLVLYKAVLEAEKLIGQMQYAEACEILEKVLEIDKNSVDALNAIAKIRIAKNDFEGAGKVLTRVLQIHPANKTAIENLEYVKKRLNVKGHAPLSAGVTAPGTTAVTAEACSGMFGKDAASKREISNQKWTDSASSYQDARLREYVCPKITVITVCLNSVSTIERSIKSVLSQTYKNIEYIFVDGGSEDGTLDVIRKHDKHVTHIISEKDNGIYDAMNKGLRLAKGSIVYFLNTDDLLYDESVFDTVVKTFQRFPLADVIYGNARLVYENGENADAIYPNNLDWKHFRDRSLCHQSVFTKRSAFEKVGLFESQYKLAGDYAWILKSIWVHDLNYQHVPKHLSLFYMGGKHSNPANVILLENERQIAINEYIAKKYDFAGTANKYKVTAFVITIDDPVFPYCLEALTNQSCKNFKVDVVRGYRPVSAADQETINRCDTEYFIKVDEDMILHPNAVEKMKEFMEFAPNNVGMICFHLYDKERELNIQGVKIFRTRYLKDFMVHNVRASDVDLLEQMHRKGIEWILHPAVMGLHGTVYSPETIYRRYKSMYEKDIFIWNILTWDIRKKAENYRKTGDPLQLFALLGAVHGIINAPHAEDIEAKDFASYNLKELDLFKKLFLENPPYTIEYDASHSAREFSSKPIPFDRVRWKNILNNGLDSSIHGQTPENKGNAVTKDIASELFTKAEELFQKGQYGEAIVNYKKAIDVNASFFDAYFNLSLVYAHLNQIDDSIACLKKAAGLHANDASVHNNLGVLYFKKKQYGDAKVCFEEALSIDIHYTEAQNNLERVSDKMRI